MAIRPHSRIAWRCRPRYADWRSRRRAARWSAAAPRPARPAPAPPSRPSDCRRSRSPRGRPAIAGSARRAGLHAICMNRARSMDVGAAIWRPDRARSCEGTPRRRCRPSPSRADSRTASPARPQPGFEPPITGFGNTDDGVASAACRSAASVPSGHRKSGRPPPIAVDQMRRRTTPSRPRRSGRNSVTSATRRSPERRRRTASASGRSRPRPGDRASSAHRASGIGVPHPLDHDALADDDRGIGLVDGDRSLMKVAGQHVIRDG